MSIRSLHLSLALGKAVPAPAPTFIAEALQSVQVVHSDAAPAAFQITFHADRTKGYSRDYALLSSPLLKPTNRVAVTVTLNGIPHVLMDGFITRQELAHDREAGSATLTVTGEDVSVLMDLIELSIEYPSMGGSEIAALVLAKYTMIGIIPDIIPTPASLIPLPEDRVPQQNSTDRQYLNEIAQPYGFVFYVTPGPEFLTNTAYWGPPKRTGTVQKPLTVDMGPGTNVESINFQYDALAPTLVEGMVQETDTGEDLPVVTLGSTREPPLASEPALLVNEPFVRRTLFTDPRVGTLLGAAEAQATTNTSADKVVTVQGQLDAIRYGDILRSPGLVNVRGVGFSYDGTYYVQSVTHTISRGVYNQNFTLTREGMGSTVEEV
jgi:hypothetical protein